MDALGMLAGLWHRLPGEVQDKIIAHIPSPEIFALRSVCKHWEGLIHCPLFLRLRDDIPQQRPWILVPRRPSSQGFLAFVPDSQRWIDLPSAHNAMPGSNLCAESVSADTGALLLLSTPRYSSKPQRLIVCSPLLRICTPAIDLCGASGSIVPGTAVPIQQPHGSIRIVAVARQSDRDVSPLEAVCYDSSTGVWIRPGGELPRDVAVSRPSSVLIDGGSRMLLVAERHGRQAVFAYGLGDHRWAQIDLPDGRLDVSNWLIAFKCQSPSVLLVQLNPVGHHVAIWRLDPAARKKEEQWICECQQRRVDVRFIQDEDEEDDLLPAVKKAVVDDCIGFENSVVICRLPHLWCFDLATKLWRWLPETEKLRETSLSSRAFCYSPMLVGRSSHATL